MAIDRITVRGARQHNLKNISIEIPRDRLTVITGLSGSGKSSLAFDTIYAEGQRRYVESLSAYARQFLDQLEKPDVDSVDGLSPAISIEQKTVSRSPRSTVGTVTEIYDYMRLLFSSVGIPHCHICGAAITRQSVDQIVQNVLGLPEGERVMVLAPIVRGRKGEFKKELEKLAKEGFIRARVDGELLSLDEEIRLDKRRNHTIEAVVDRLLIKTGIRDRLTDSIRTALKLTGGAVLISIVDGEEKLYSERMACVNCGINVPPLEPRSFSFNSAYGACKRCHGLGTVMEIDSLKLIPDPWQTPERLGYMGSQDKQGSAYLRSALLAVCKHFNADSKKAFADLPKEVRDGFLNGVSGKINFNQGLYSYQNEWKGALPWLKERLSEAPSEKIRIALEELVSPSVCSECNGRRLRSDSLSVQVGGRGIAEYTSLPIDDAVEAFDQVKLHARDNQKLLETLSTLRDLGNTVLVVEHDEETIRRADYVVDLGPGAGAHGGEVVAVGTASDVAENPESITGLYIRGARKIEVPAERRSPNGKYLTITGAYANNLKEIDVSFPLGLLTVVTGVSGSGKSTLVEDILYYALAQHLYGSHTEPGPYRSIEGLEHIDKVIEIDQSPIGRTPRSNPATYTGLFTFIRDLFAWMPEAKARGFKAGRFSFNVKGGRCEACQGDGVIAIEMHFLPDVYVTCEQCKGRRYNRETLDIKYRGKSIADVLDLTVDQAAPLLENFPPIANKLRTLQEVGLGYIELGQSATTLSGGEAQRVKLSKELSRRSTGSTLYILDEPTTGLHFADTHKLLDVLNKLVDQGNTVVIIEHNLDVIQSADYVIDLGPEGGGGGGRVVATGTPEAVARSRESFTGRFLAEILGVPPI